MNTNMHASADFIDNRQPLPAITHMTLSLVDIWLSLPGAEPHRLLSGSRIFYQDLAKPGYQVNCQQLFVVVKNLLKQPAPEDLGFRLGRRLAPASRDPLNQAMINSITTGQALKLLHAYHRLYSPLFTLRRGIRRGADSPLYLVLSDAVGMGEAGQFLVEALLGKLTGTGKSLEMDTSDWQYFIRRDPPAVMANHQKYLGNRLVFDAPLNGLAIPAYQLRQTLPGASPLSRQQRQQSLQQSLQQRLLLCRQALRGADCRPFLPETVSALLQASLHTSPLGLEGCAQALAMSPATLKRKLKAHNCRFQDLADEVRTLLALDYLYLRGKNSEFTARRLHFNDTANFRRSFKRWTGTLPSRFRTVATNP